MAEPVPQAASPAVAGLPWGWELTGGQQALRCVRLAVAHGFSTRLGGVSEGPHATLNLASTKGDRPEHVQENQRRFREACGLSAPWTSLRQVHGGTALQLSDAASSSEGDALVSSWPEGPVAVYMADCTPVLLASATGTVVAAIHSGWRGTEANVVGSAIAAMADLGVGPADIVAAIGPAARKCCYEVGDEVVERLEQIAPSASRDDREGWLAQGPARAHVDLAVVIRRQLRAAGVLADAIEDCGLCTICRPDLFFSYRRDGVEGGRMVAAIVPSRAP